MVDERYTALHAWLSCHHGITSHSVLESLGFSRWAISRLVSSDRLEPVAKGIYRSPTHPFGRIQLMVAACLLVPDGAIGFTTAGQEWGFRRMSDLRVHLLVPHGSSPTIGGVVVHRCRRIDPVDLTARRLDGVRLTSPPRTLLDAASIIGVEGTESAIEQALDEHRCTIGTLMATSRRLHHGNRPGSAAFEQVLVSRPKWRGLAKSELERTVRAAVVQAGLPAPQMNWPFQLSPTEPIFIDLAWVPWRIAAEVDHPFWHDRDVEIRRDKRRDRKLQAMGWATPRLTQHDIDHELDAAVDDLMALLVQRGWRPGDDA
jgi:hypothetical protein